MSEAKLEARFEKLLLRELIELLLLLLLLLEDNSHSQAMH